MDAQVTQEQNMDKKPDEKPGDDQALVLLLQEEERQAVGYRTSEISEAQELALEYYNGELLGNEEEGKSQVISKDVASTIDGIMPDLIKVFLSGDRVVEFEPEKPEDEPFADQATDYANYIFYNDNDGYTITHDWAKDGLINRVGIVKVFWDDSTEKVRETYTGLNPEAVVALAQKAEILNATENEDGTIDVTIMREKPKGRVIIENVPPEEFLLASRTRSLREADYTAHKVRKTVGELINMGFDEDTVKNLSTHQDEDLIDTREQERYKDENYLVGEEDSMDPMMREIWVIQEWIRTDWDEDGTAELRQVTRVNKTILENIEVDEHPFCDFTPNKMPHKVIGRSMADSTMDIQKIKTTLLRQSLDNIYISNSPRIILPEGSIGDDTYDDILTPRPGSPIRVKRPEGVMPLTIPFTAKESFGMLDYWDNEREQRTGVTRYNQGLDADTLNQTATGVKLIQQKGMGKIELIARNLGNGFGMLFEKIIKLTIKHQEEERVIQLRGKWVPMEPNQWNANMKVRVRVGLGSGDKSETIQGRTFLMQLQQNALGMGLVTPQHIYNNVSKMVKDMDLGEPDDYWPNPETSPPIQQKQDPAMQKLQMDAQAKQQEMQLKQQAAMAAIDLKTREAEAKIDLEHKKMQQQAAKVQMDMQLQREKAALEEQLARDKAIAEVRLSRETTALNAQLRREEMAIKAQSGNYKTAVDAQTKLSSNRPGGSLNK